MAQDEESAEDPRGAKQAHTRETAGERDSIISPLAGGAIIAAALIAIPSNLLHAHLRCGGIEHSSLVRALRWIGGLLFQVVEPLALLIGWFASIIGALVG